jgi:hypothetical protein
MTPADRVEAHREECAVLFIQRALNEGIDALTLEHNR